ncbi:MAG TPA: hypothetical protein PL041_01325 [Melioribacteraceae bacterium]|nr:hypothetical protein [Melioribacteraceae bacterium]
MAKSGDKKYYMPNLIRKYYGYKIGKNSFNEEDAKLLLSEFKNIVYFKMEADSKKLLTSDDLANEMFLLLDNATLKYSEFFESVLEETEENDKRIIGYVYAFVNTGKRLLSNFLDDRENNLLGLAIKSACKNLIEKEEIIVTKSGRYDYYTYKDNLIKENFNGQEILLQAERIMKKNSIDRVKLEEYLLYIFKTYPNYKFAIYNLVELVALNTNVGTVKIFNEVTDSENDDKEINTYDNLTDNNLQDIEYSFIISSLPGIWWSRILKKFGSKDLAEKYAIIFYLSYCKGYTLKQIEIFYNKTMISSTIDNYKKIFVKALEIEKDLDSNNVEIFKKSLDSFYLLLETEYAISLKLGVRHE